MLEHRYLHVAERKGRERRLDAVCLMDYRKRPPIVRLYDAKEHLCKRTQDVKLKPYRKPRPRWKFPQRVMRQRHGEHWRQPRPLQGKEPRHRIYKLRHRHTGKLNTATIPRLQPTFRTVEKDIEPEAKVFGFSLLLPTPTQRKERLPDNAKTLNASRRRTIDA